MSAASPAGRRSLGVALAILAIAVAPWLVPSYTAFELTYAGAYAIAILGLVILTGMCGQISLGHGSFLAIGGYTVAILGAAVRIPVWASIAVAALVCAAVGVALGLVALRLEGIYMALATFALAVTVPSILKRFKDLTGGVGGITLNSASVPAGLHGLLRPSALRITGPGCCWRRSSEFRYVLAGSRRTLLARAARQRDGRGGVRRQPADLQDAGLRVERRLRRDRGRDLAIATAYVSPDIYGFSLSLTLVIGAVLGGLDLLWGALIGGLLVEFLPLWTQKINAAAPSVVYGVALIVVMIVLPGGIAGAIGRIFRKAALRAPQTHNAEEAIACE